MFVWSVLKESCKFLCETLYDLCDRQLEDHRLKLVPSPEIIPCGWFGWKHPLTDCFVTFVYDQPCVWSHWQPVLSAPQWGAAPAEIKVPSGENTEHKRSPFKAWTRSVYSHKCCAYCQEVFPCLFLPFQSIHLHFFPKPLRIFSLRRLWLTPVPV